MQKKVKRKFNFRKFLFFIIFLFLLYMGISYLISVKTKNIVILNNNYYSDDDIIYTAGIEDYPKFILLNKNKIKDKLLKLDLIEDVTINKRFGFILEITVKEKKILYYIRSTNLYKASDNKSYELNNMIGIPTLINYIPENIEKNFVNKLSNVDSEILSMISEIEYSKTTYDDKRFLLYMNDGNMVYITVSKAELLNKYVEIIKKVDNKKGILYLDSGNYFEIKEK
ncbi:MAG: FtsQ-type POTRA domain-containing protein [Tenericutes bacterium]|nr:FtsQ-type POTRA domain-containing protein [Mycoplasmatota bacterium]